MQDSAFTVFIVFGCIWILMGIAAVIWLLKSDQQSFRLTPQGIAVAVSILVPIAIALLYQVVRSTP